MAPPGGPACPGKGPGLYPKDDSEDYGGRQYSKYTGEIKTSFQGPCARNRIDPVKRRFSGKTGEATHCMSSWERWPAHRPCGW